MSDATEAAKAALAREKAFRDDWAEKNNYELPQSNVTWALEALLVHTEAVEADRDRLRLIHVGTGKLALAAIFLADTMEDDASMQAVKAEYICPYIDRAEKAEAERDHLRAGARDAHDKLVWMAVELGWATDGRLSIGVSQAQEVLRVRTAERDAALAVIATVRARHQPKDGSTPRFAPDDHECEREPVMWEDYTICNLDGAGWPCPTVVILDAGHQSEGPES